jgi:hypothetical protein
MAESSLDDAALTNRFAFTTREFISGGAAVNTVVGIGLAVMCLAPVISVPIAINEAVRIVRFGARFAIAAGSKDITYSDAGVLVQVGPTLIGVDIFPFIQSGPGGGLGNFGLAIEVEDEIYYGTDFSGAGFAPPALVFNPYIQAFGGAAAHTVIGSDQVLIERFLLKPNAPLRG